MNYEQEIDRYRQRIAELDEKIGEYEALWKRTGGRFSENFRARVGDARAEHSRLTRHLAQIQLEQFSASDAENQGLSMLKIFDEIGARVEKALKGLDQEVQKH
ncbi:MAG: hypothetical protein K0U93_01290 [Gammaproteobacteria bacterium]|nr:hypothetical protein [Gammaproteobacteria bacterium]